MNIPKQILNIHDFLTSCKYDSIYDEKNTYYRSPKRIDKEKKCICFDGAIYAYTKLKQLNPQLNPQILSIFGLRIENGIKKNVAHSICVFKIKDKFGAIGKSATQEMSIKDLIYPNLDTLALSFTKEFFNKNIWPMSHVIEDDSNFNQLINGSEKDLFPHNQIFKPKRKESFEIKQVTQYLNEIQNIPKEKINELLTQIRGR